MKLVDANVLLYAANEDAALHEPSIGWINRAMSSEETIGFAWIVLLAFLRISTRSGILPRPLSVADAFDVMESWLAQTCAVQVHPSARHNGLLRGLIDEVGIGGNLVNDAHLAALAIEHGATIVSFDSDFGRFAGVRWERPT